MNTTELLLIDLSSLAYPIWHMSGNEPDQDYVSRQTITRVRTLAADHAHAAICCDSGKSFRHDLSPREAIGDGKYRGYKANRPEKLEPLLHQIRLACETLKADGFAIWSSLGYEADDIIATATKEALAIDGTTVLIASADKDLLQLVNDRVRVKKLTNGDTFDAEAVTAKFGITAAQFIDYLCLVGDTSDNIDGAKGIGGVIAAQLLKEHGSLDALYAKMKNGVVPGVTPARRTALMEFRDRWPLTRQLVTLKADAPIPFAEIAVERTVAPMADPEPDPTPLPSPEPPMPSGGQAVAPAAGDLHSSVPNEGTSGQLIPVDYTQQLEPRNMDEAVKLAQRMFDSRLFAAYGTPQAVLATVLAGRELGIPAMAALRAFHIIEGKPTLSAGTIQSLVLTSGKARYFRCIERTDTRATFATQRGNDPEMRLSFTVEEGRRAFGYIENDPESDKRWQRSGWRKNPADMCVARASSKLARLVYPDVVSGLYAPEEME